jgi:hypothetical protein
VPQRPRIEQQEREDGHADPVGHYQREQHEIALEPHDHSDPGHRNGIRDDACPDTDTHADAYSYTDTIGMRVLPCHPAVDRPALDPQFAFVQHLPRRRLQFKWSDCDDASERCRKHRKREYPGLEPGHAFLFELVPRHGEMVS